MGRQRCSRCDRAVRVCLCAELPSSPLPTRTSVVVLQHPHEARHKLSTLPLLGKCLANCHILQGRRFHAGVLPILDLFSSQHPSPFFHALLLFPSPEAQPIASWYEQVMRPCTQGFAASTSLCAVGCPFRVPMSDNIELGFSADDFSASCHTLKGPWPDPPDIEFSCATETQGFNPSHQARMLKSLAHDAAYSRTQQEGSCYPRILLIAVDATWRHAREMIKASAPYLDKFVVPVCLPFNANEEGSCMANSELIIRKEPCSGCMTTLEAISRCLKVLEPNGAELHDKLTCVLRRMVHCQASNVAFHKVRVKKGSEAHSNTEETGQSTL